MQPSELEKFYEDDAYCGFGDDIHSSRYNEYAEFVKNNLKGKVYEIGSGLGLAAMALKSFGVDIVATDIYPQNASKTFAKNNQSILVEKVNINQIDKAEGSVENICCYQVIEHIENPKLAFSEIYRVLKPGGRFLLVGPNLISPLATAKNLVYGLLGRWPFPWVKRTDHYSYPHGDTLLEIFIIMIKNFWLTFIRVIFSSARKPRFRKPCLTKPAVSDSDAVFFLNPMDASALLEKTGFKIISYQSQRFSGSWAGSTWLVAQKP